MLPKISRYLLVLLSIITLAYALPVIYNTLFDSRIDTPYITYSELNKEYLVMRNVDGKPTFVDRKGKTYTQQEYMNVTPVANFQYHLSRGTLPDSLNGVKLNPKQLQYESFFQYISPDKLYTPVYGLYPLFESEPEFGLSLPADVFRINKRMEFIDAKSNRIDERKTDLYTGILQQNGFAFPAKLAAGIPSVMKRRDQGWFIEDQNGKLYHLKMLKGKPYFKKIPNTENVRVKHIICNDFDSDEFYALIISVDNKLYTLNKKDYSMSLLPVPDYDPEKQTLLVSGNLFNKTVLLVGERSVRAYTIDRNYRQIDQLNTSFPIKAEMTNGKIFSAIFPFYLQLSSPYTEFIKMAYHKVPGYNWLLLNLVFLIISLVWMKREERKLSRGIPDLVIVALTGVFGFLAVWMFPDKTY